jgi:positive regulator of sigma E activity
VKWHNCNVGFKVSINSGAALVIYLVQFQILIIEAAIWPAVERLFPVAIGALTGAFAGFLVKRNANNKLTSTAELEKIKSGCEVKQEGV